MHVITKLNLDNDLDLMLAHKRSMQVAEFAGLGLVHQTSFATAVSEVCRLVLDKGSRSHMMLGFLKTPHGKNSVYAKIVDTSIGDIARDNPNLGYARRLVSGFSVDPDSILLLFEMPVGSRLSREYIIKGQKLFDEMPPVTPYEQAKQLNMQLQEMANKLVESEKRYQTLTDTIPLMMFTLNDQGRLLFANEGFKLFAGSDIQNVGGNWINWLSGCEPSVPVEQVREQLSGNSEFSMEISLTKKSNGERIWHLLSMSPVLNSSTGLPEWAGFLVNIQAQKLVEETLRDNAELRDTKRVLQKRQIELDATITDLNRKNQELARFAYVASHDLQEPARKMIVFSEMLNSRFGHLLPADGTSLLNRVKSGSERMVAVIRDLLDYSGISADQDIDVHPIELLEIVDQVREHLDKEISESNAEIQLRGSATLVGNRRLLVLLFQNFVGNAIKFVRDGAAPRIQITYSFPAAEVIDANGLDQQTTWVQVDVSDNGIGFDEKHVDRIFQMFQRLHTQDQFKGTGIGLAICKRIIEMHRGSISVKSKINQGSVFSVYLPYQINPPLL